MAERSAFTQQLFECLLTDRERVWTSADLAREQGWKLPKVKKALQALRLEGAVQVLNHCPKEYRLDPFWVKEQGL